MASMVLLRMVSVHVQTSGLILQGTGAPKLPISGSVFVQNGVCRSFSTSAVDALSLDGQNHAPVGTPVRLRTDPPTIPAWQMPASKSTHHLGRQLTGLNRTWVSADLSARQTFGWPISRPKVRSIPPPPVILIP